MDSETAKDFDDKDSPISVKFRKDVYNFAFLIACCVCIYFGNDFFSTTRYNKNDLLKVKAVVEKEPELHITSGRNKRYYVTFKIRGLDEIEMKRQAAFSMQEFVDEVKKGDTIVIQTPYHSVIQENKRLILLSSFEVIGVSKGSKEYINYEIYAKGERRNTIICLVSSIWSIFLSLLFREAQETPRVLGREMKFFDTLIAGIFIIWTVVIFW